MEVKNIVVRLKKMLENEEFPINDLNFMQVIKQNILTL
jgi:hypothetical protein